MAVFSVNGNQVQASNDHHQQHHINDLQSQSEQTLQNDLVLIDTVQRQDDQGSRVLRDNSGPVIRSVSTKHASTSYLFRHVRQTDGIEPDFENCSDIHDPPPQYNNSICDLVLEECDDKYELFNYLEFVMCILGEQTEVSSLLCSVCMCACVCVCVWGGVCVCVCV